MTTITNRTIGKINPLHGVNCAPYKKSDGSHQTLVKKIFGYARPPHSRLHDVCGSYGGTYYVDIPNIFHDFNADENDPASYDFHYSDEYITAIIETGTQIVYRLGVTMEHGSKKYTTFPPSDYDKWARICEHIVMHYNEGWCGGFHYNIEYWEIWNEPENPPMWSGTKEQFFALYETASKHLKSRFPSLHIGGYGSCGFYAVSRENSDDLYKGFVSYFTDFLAFIKKNACPLDFFSWHIYTANAGEITVCTRYVRKLLDDSGFASTEVHLNEWNYGAEGGGFDDMETLVGAGYCASALIAMQYAGVDKAQYYCLSSQSAYNGFVHLRTKKYTPVIHVFAAFDTLYRAGEMLRVECDDCDAADILAAKSEQGTFVLISNYGKSKRKLSLCLQRAKKDEYVHLYELRSEGGFHWIGSMEADTVAPIELTAGGVYFAAINRCERADTILGGKNAE